VLFVLKPQDALELLSFGQVDPKKIALLEDTPPENISQPEDASADQASVTQYSANNIQLKTSTETSGLLMLSEVYYPAWKAISAASLPQFMCRMGCCARFRCRWERTRLSLDTSRAHCR
jgi:hypothetical protein